MFVPDVEHILNHYLAASDDIVEDGMTWYNRAREFALSLDENVSRAAAVVAVISANTSWTANKTLAIKAYQGDMAVGFPDKVRKVTRLFSGESPDTVLGGTKVRTFYATILDPTASHPAVIDRHAFDIAINKRLGSAKRPLGKANYALFADTYANAASLAGITTQQMQAITWVQWRKSNGITA